MEWIYCSDELPEYEEDHLYCRVIVAYTNDDSTTTKEAEFVWEGNGNYSFYKPKRTEKINGVYAWIRWPENPGSDTVQDALSLIDLLISKINSMGEEINNFRMTVEETNQLKNEHYKGFKYALEMSWEDNNKLKQEVDRLLKIEERYLDMMTAKKDINEVTDEDLGLVI